MNKQNNVRKKVIIITTVFVSVCITVAIAGILSYKFADRIIEYEYNDSKIEKTVTTETNIEEPNILPEHLPESTFYKMYLENGMICIYDSNNKLLYTQQFPNLHVLTKKDIKELEQDGITYTTRSEIIEILHYLKT